jgi:glycosyltransferase involved in cell wall biosynthesis
MSITNPKITVMMVSYNRPLFLREAIPSLIENAGCDFELIIWDNGSTLETRQLALNLQSRYGFELLINQTNIGQQAWGRILERARGKYFVLTEDDMIWFQPNWLKNLVMAFETKPGLTAESKAKGAQNEWGAMATNVLVDEVNNGGMWASRFKGMSELCIKGINLWAGIGAGAGAMIFDTELLKSFKIMTPNVPPFGKCLDWVINKYAQEKYPMAHVRDTYIYHAASPFFNQLYPEVWLEKQTDQTIAQAMKVYLKKCNFKFKGNEWILEKLKDGTFKEYAEKLYKIFDNGRGRLYSFQLAEKNQGRGVLNGHQVRTRRKGRKASKGSNKKI